MIALLDVNYGTTTATTACVIINAWRDSRPADELVARTTIKAPYRPGRFFLRELPCLLDMLNRLPTNPAVLVIDGHVWLTPGKPGLGYHLYQAVDGRAAVVGVAKTPFKGSPDAVKVLRGRSSKPLYITAEGMPPQEAAFCIQSMAGPHRLPAMIKRVDRLCRAEALGA